VRGSIVHSWDGDEEPMQEGDITAISAGVVHNARNVGGVPAELNTCYSTGIRETVFAEEA